MLGWAAILFLALLLRSYGLNLNPVGISHDDELNEILNAKSVALTQTQRPGFVAGILTQTDQCKFIGDCVYGELGTYIQVPWMYFSPLGLAFSRIFFVLISLGLVIATGKLFENFSKSTTIGMITGLFVAINPWAIYYGRTAHTILASHLFYCLAAYYFTRPNSYKSNLIFGGITAFIASLIYFGAKPILPLIIIWGVSYNLYQFGFRNIKFTFQFLLVAMIVIGGYLLILSNSYAGKRFTDIENGRQENVGITIELGGSTSWRVGRQVDKVTPRIDSFLGFFSASSLFLTGQRASDNYYLSGHGYYYLADFIFLILGIMAISSRFGRAMFILLLIAISITPTAIKISGTSIYSHRASLAYPLISGIMAWGLYFCWSKVPAKPFLAKIFLLSAAIVYSGSLIYFLFVYWYRSPVEQSTRWFFHERVLASYITRVQKNNENKKLIVISGRPDGIFNSYVFYSGVYNNKEGIIEINSKYLERDYAYRGAMFTDDCSKIAQEDLAENIIFIDKINNPECEINLGNTSRISNPRDAGVIYNIVNDSLCKDYSIGRYPYPKSIHDFSVENQTDEVFCKTWITNPEVN
ncbi:MAG: hypothetical protein UV74_C0013G0051 [Candidatus Woesebacteria bacterium GW2011_GWB1_43_14]|uniref:Glycosyltransferase RgtA/B/C/D-like domain-containing protein n=1 Tax=Candidatus Woesebacteria bacterium GW2011_GWB1_43_14 TaxID=1618578 RepID=A0A0G1DGV7_9BACT|nr:MAG: hypothetical protein UV51_C0005G0172 [Candidatus Woesebacteria bacterium GW2011_GWC1_42_9]KKS96929.1 MAG: hypothetical protein UV74_C0013G0051 [Candidatus Woesebacteria bacterium GW2011_GWB1_43_14]